jgi:asparagine synthase (glutamine-hydrolysing)
MCGIAGVVRRDGREVVRSELERVTRALSHRGPDGQGVRCEGSVGLGHRRLSIIDIGGGAQPMSNEDNSVHVTFNGEIYNYRELQDDLEARGHVFASRCDTEVLVHAWEEWGADCPKYLRGMWAFAIHDTRQQKLFVCRDRLGVKPLWTFCDRERFAFASELQALEQLEEFPQEIEPRALGAYFQLGYIPAPLSIWTHVAKLPPAHYLLIDLGQTPVEIPQPQPYWSIDWEVDASQTDAQWHEELDALLREATRLRLRSDVPFGAFLSGGVDSSLVVAYMAQLLDSPVRTFSIGFEAQGHKGESISELPFAREAAQRCGAQHHERVVGLSDLSLLPTLVRHYGEPFGDSSAVPTYLVSQLAREHVKMVLSGDGGDESFAGYTQYYSALSRIAPGGQGWKRALRRVAGNALRTARVLPPLNSPEQVWLMSVRTSTDEDRAALTRGGPIDALTPVTQHVVLPSANGEDAARGFLNAVHALDFRFYLPNDILFKVDSASMAHGLEVRGPLLDHRVVELAARLPLHQKMRLEEGEPRPFLHRPKQGFAAPLAQWFTGSELDAMRARLLDPANRLGEFLNVGAIESLVRRQREHGDRFSLLWQLLWLGEWFAQHPRAHMS